MMSDLTRLAGDMGTYIYLTVKIVCAVYILYRLWFFLFRRKAEGLWDRLYRWARMIRIMMWRWHKRRMASKAEREKRLTVRNQKKKKEAAAVAPSTHCEVIGKTKSVYIRIPRKQKNQSEASRCPNLISSARTMIFQPMMWMTFWSLWMKRICRNLWNRACPMPIQTSPRP